MRALVILGLAVAISGCRANQVDKVVSLLQDLHNEVSAEREADAKAYDEFACFCRDQMSEKVHVIDKSSALIDQMEKKRDAAEAARDTARSNAQRSAGKLSEHKNNIENLQERRKEDHDSFLADQKMLQNAIDATKHAIKAIKNSQNTMSEAKIDLLSILSGTAKTDSTRTALLQTVQKPHTYVTQGGEILGLLQNLMDEYIAKLNEANENEITSKNESGEDVDSNERGKDIEENSLDANQAIETEKEATKKDLDEKIKLEEEARTADKNFLADLNNQCEQRARQHRQNDSTRADELQAFTSAITVLNEASGAQDAGGVSSRYKFAQIHATNFLQLGNGKAQATREAVKLLQRAARSLGSSDLAYLSMLSIRANDPFVEVRSKISDLISKLVQQKSDEEAKYNENSKKHAELDEKIAGNEDELERLKTAIAGLKGTIAKNENSLLEQEETLAKEEEILRERDELHQDRKKALKEAIDQAKEGEEKVEEALKTLQAFYNKAGENEEVSVADSTVGEASNAEKRGRDGKSMADLAPSSGSNYQGSQNRSQGVLGLLGTILDDFTRSGQEFKTELEEEKADYESSSKESTDLINNAKQKIASLSSEIGTDKSSLSDEIANEEGEDEELKSNKNLLAVLHKSVNTGENFEKEKERRTKEINALKEALSILEAVGKA